MSSLDLLHTLLQAPSESEVLEFKKAETRFDFEKLGQYFSALSNEANLRGLSRARLILGVDDKSHEVVGTSAFLDHKKLHSLKKGVADQTTGRVSFINIHEVSHPNGRVIMFEIPAAPQGIPIAWKGHYYARDHESLVPLNLEKIERIRTQATTSDWSAQIIEEATIHDLSPEAIQKARKAFITKNLQLESDIHLWDDTTFLNKAMVTIQGKITRTAILLLGKAESEPLIHPGSSRISWILRDSDNMEKDYEHFSCPLILAVDEVYGKIRNLKYRYLKDETLFPEEVYRYDPYVIREALHNCIAHQDYSLGGTIHVVEYEDDKLVFQNAGDFIPGSVEEVIDSDAPEPRNRNKFLSRAMVNLNMIDTIGSGIKKMFHIQRDRLFPLPDYDLKNQKVKVMIIGKVLDLNYARKLSMVPGLSLSHIILLDKIQKKKPLSDEEIKKLRKEKLIEGRKPNFHISASVANETDQKGEYIIQKGLDDDHYKQLIVELISQFRAASRKDIDNLLIGKLPEIMDEEQKLNKIRNLIQVLSRNGQIYNEGTRSNPLWRIGKSKIDS